MKLGIKHQGLKPYKIYNNDDPEWTLTELTEFTLRATLISHTSTENVLIKRVSKKLLIFVVSSVTNENIKLSKVKATLDLYFS